MVVIAPCGPCSLLCGKRNTTNSHCCKTICSLLWKHKLLSWCMFPFEKVWTVPTWSRQRVDFCKDELQNHSSKPMMLCRERKLHNAHDSEKTQSHKQASSVKTGPCEKSHRQSGSGWQEWQVCLVTLWKGKLVNFLWAQHSPVLSTRKNDDKCSACSSISRSKDEDNGVTLLWVYCMWGSWQKLVFAKVGRSPFCVHVWLSIT